MTIAYLVNRYPTTSHSFIRREILALEQLGSHVIRHSIRPTAGEHVDPGDAEEASRTNVILASGPAVLGALARIGARFPNRLASAARMMGRIAYRSDRGWIPHVAYLAEACALLESLEKTGARHLHAHFGTNSATVAALCRELGGPPYSFTVHGPEEFDRALVLGLKEKILHADFVVAISDYGRSQLCRLVDPEHWHKIHVVRCGLQRELLEGDSTPVTARARFVCVGRLHEQKGHLVLLEAAAELVRRGLEFQVVFAGDGPLRESLERSIEELGLASRVCITGWLTEQQVIAELKASTALVLPSFAEGLPVVIMEAMALGRPVVSTFVAGIPELVEPSVNGWLVPAGSVDALADVLVKVIDTNLDTLTAMGQRGKCAVRERHDVLASAERLRSLMGEAAS